MKKHIDFTKAIVNILSKKLPPDERFRILRVEEWRKSFPVPAREFDDSDERQKFADLHDHLTALAAFNSSRSSYWDPEEQSDFEEALEALSELVETGKVGEYNRATALYHQHILERARGLYGDSLATIEESTKIIREKIESGFKHVGVFRDYLSNIGNEAAALQMDDRREESIKRCQYLLSEFSRFDRDEIELYERKNNFTNMYALCFFFFADCIIGPSEKDKNFENEVRNFVLSKAFGEGLYKKWPLPAMLEILRSQGWRQNAPDYFDEISSIVYVKSTNDHTKRLLRRISVMFGRRELRLAPTAFAAAVAIAVVIYALYGSGELDEDLIVNIADVKVEIMDAALEIKNKVDLSSRQIEELEEAVQNVELEFEKASESDNINVNSFLDYYVTEGSDKLELEAFAVAVNSNERVILGRF